MKGKRKIAVNKKDGHIGLIEKDIPETKPGNILVEVHSSLVSPGTELGGWHNLKHQLEHPEKDAEPRPFGYSNSGIILETGKGVKELEPGDRVACIGSGYALHSDYALIPKNLCVKLPENVSFAEGSYAMLAATALHALRRGEPRFGEYAGIVGLGILGQLSAQLYQLSGNYVIGWDLIKYRTEIAKKWGIEETVVVNQEDEIETTRVFTEDRGLDSAVIAFGGDGDQAFSSIISSLKCSPDGHPMGKIVVVGNPEFKYRYLTNVDVRKASRTGPGYHDEEWETGDKTYPDVFMRWTTKSNLRLCMRLISEGKLDVQSLTTHKIALKNVESEINNIIEDPDKILGVVFEMDH